MNHNPNGPRLRRQPDPETAEMMSQRAAAYVHDAGLDLSLREHGGDRVREALQAVDHGEAPSTCQPKIANGGLLAALCGSRDTGDLRPKLGGAGACGLVFGGSDVLAAERKEVVDLIMRREEPLCLAGGFEPLHLPFASPGRLM